MSYINSDGYCVLCPDIKCDMDCHKCTIAIDYKNNKDEEEDQ